MGNSWPPLGSTHSAKEQFNLNTLPDARNARKGYTQPKQRRYFMSHQEKGEGLDLPVFAGNLLRNFQLKTGKRRGELAGLL